MVFVHTGEKLVSFQIMPSLLCNLVKFGSVAGSDGLHGVCNRTVQRASYLEPLLSDVLCYFFSDIARSRLGLATRTRAFSHPVVSGSYDQITVKRKNGKSSRWQIFMTSTLCTTECFIGFGKI